MGRYYGRRSVLVDLDQRKTAAEGDEAHKKAIAGQEKIIKQQSQK